MSHEHRSDPPVHATVGAHPTTPGAAQPRPDGGANLLDGWTEDVRRELGITGPVDRSLVLDLARDVAHGVARPAAPLTTYLLGVAVGAGMDPADAAARVGRLIAARPTDD